MDVALGAGNGNGDSREPESEGAESGECSVLCAVSESRDSFLVAESRKSSCTRWHWLRGVFIGPHFKLTVIFLFEAHRILVPVLLNLFKDLRGKSLLCLTI